MTELPDMLPDIDPDPDSTPDLAAIHAAALEIDEWRALAGGISQKQLVKRFAQLGSTKTFNVFLRGQDGRDAAAFLPGYLTALDIIRREGAEAADEILYDDLSGPAAVRQIAQRILTSPDNGRFGLITGETGAGKTSILTCLSRMPAYRTRIIPMQAVIGLTESGFGFLGQLLLALDASHTEASVKKLPGTLALRLAKAQERLRARRLIVAIEEAQDLGEGALKMIKTLINTTPSGFLCMAIPSLWTTLARSNYADAAQLVENRCAGIVRLTLTDTDLQQVIRRRCRHLQLDARGMRQAITALRKDAAKRGSFKFITRALAHAVALAPEEDNDDAPVTFDHIEAGIALELQNRNSES